MAKDYYEVLGVDKNASKDEIKKAYKKLAKKYHPDISQEEDAENKFKEINDAANVLLDDEKKKNYDTYGSAEGPAGGAGGFGGFGGGAGGFGGIDLDDLFEQFGFGSSGFEDFFGGGGSSRGGRRRDTSEYNHLNLDLEDVYFQRRVNVDYERDEECSKCHGKGAEKDEDISTCSVCGGAGVVVEVQRSILGAMKTQRPCHQCGGTGKEIKNPCGKCKGKGVERKKETIEVEVPAGIEDGMTLRLSGKGSYDPDSHTYGDLYLRVNIKEHKTYDVSGADLYMTKDINFVQAILGDEIDFEHFDKTLSLKIPTGTQPETVLRLKGKGLPHYNGGTGDLYIKVNVQIPTKTSSEQRKILMDYAKTLKDKSLVQRLKKWFG